LFLLATFAAQVAMASDGSESRPAAGSVLRGIVVDPSGAAIPNAAIELDDANGKLANTISGADGSFLITVQGTGTFTLIVNEDGFTTSRTKVTINSTAPAPALKVVMSLASFSTTVQVNSARNQDLTDSAENSDSSVMTSSDLKALPIFDNDYGTAMSAFMDQNVTATSGSGLLVDGVEANRATVSASAVQEVRINQDPYSARYYWPGRGQMEIITKSTADHYHGQFNFIFRDSALNAQNALAPSKPFEQHRVYEGSATGPIPHAPKNSFLVSFNRAEEDLDAVVSATVAPTIGNPTGAFSQNVPAPTRDTEFSIRTARQFNENNQGYIQYSYEDWTGENQGVGGQTLAAAGYNVRYREDDVSVHTDSALSHSLYNQLTLVAESDSSRRANIAEATQILVPGDFLGGSAQADALSTELNGRLFEMLSWTHGRHLIRFGAGIPHFSRRGYDDNTNELGTYTFGPTLAPDGVTVLESSFDNLAANLPSGFSQNTGIVHFVYHQQELGAFVQDQFKLSAKFSITPGVRYDWQNFLAADRLGISPRVSFAWVFDEKSKTVLRGGGGVYYDRFGSGPLLDLARYENARRRSVLLSLDPASEPGTGCVPITDCYTLSQQPPALAQLMPHARIPYQIQYGLSVERQIGEEATAVLSGYSARGIDSFRSVDINAPTEASDYTERPDPNYGRIRQMQPEGFWEGYGLDFSFRGRVNKYFTGFGRYTWSHFESDTGGIGWFPQNQQAPNDEWSNAGFDRRHRMGMYAIVNQKSVFNIAMGIFANTGTPYTVLTGTDNYGDDLFNSRPDGVGRNSETNPSYVDVDLRWGHDFHITQNKDDDAPKLGFSAGAFNLMNHENGTSVDPVITSATFGQVIAVAPPRRIQLGMRFEF
jgi:hypothetical protein